VNLIHTKKGNKLPVSKYLA